MLPLQYHTTSIGIDQGKEVTEKKDDSVELGKKGDETLEPWLDELTPRQIVEQLDRYIVGQNDAKRAVAIAVRNRWRRQQAPEDIRDEIMPNNIIMIGPTGVGKTEIARRLARLSGAPFVKVEATKFTEVGYVGRDVESMIRDLVDRGINMVRTEREEDVMPLAQDRTEERLLDLLLPRPEEQLASPPPLPAVNGGDQPRTFVVGQGGTTEALNEADREAQERYRRTREKLKKLLQDEKLEDREVEVEISHQGFPLLDLMNPMQGGEGTDINLGEMLQDILPKKSKRRQMKVSEARRVLLDEELKKLVDMDDVINEALDRTENSGMIFIDELDKIVGEKTQSGPDVSREGVQRDLLPIVEGSTVQTRYGYVRTDHILFLATGAFQTSKPSDLIPELQGRFPIRVELSSLTERDFVKIMTEPENALTKQYKALVAADGGELEFTEDGIDEIARIAFLANEKMENIGARRLHTVMTTLLDEFLFDLPDIADSKIVCDKAMVSDRLQKVVEDEDLRKYIL